jgi:hypothetical protein
MDNNFYKERLDKIIRYIESLYQCNSEYCKSDIKSAEKDYEERKRVLKESGQKTEPEDLKIEVFQNWDGENGFVTVIVYSGDKFIEKSTFGIYKGEIYIEDQYIPKYFFENGQEPKLKIKTMSNNVFLPPGFFVEYESDGLYRAIKAEQDKVYKIKVKGKTHLLAWNSNLSAKEKGFKINKKKAVPINTIWSVRMELESGDVRKGTLLNDAFAIPQDLHKMVITNYLDNDYLI